MPHQLPSGRHGLPRSFVESNQRERMLGAVVEVAERSGYAGLDGARHHRTRRRLPPHLLRALREQGRVSSSPPTSLVTSKLAEEVAAASRRGRTWAERVALGLATFLRRFSREPALAHLCVVEVLAAGAPGLAGRAAAMEAFRAQLQPGVREAPAGLPVPALAAETAIGGAHEVVYSHVLGDAPPSCRGCSQSCWRSCCCHSSEHTRPPPRPTAAATLRALQDSEPGAHG